MEKSVVLAIVLMIIGIVIGVGIGTFVATPATKTATITHTSIVPTTLPPKTITTTVTERQATTITRTTTVTKLQIATITKIIARTATVTVTTVASKPPEGVFELMSWNVTIRNGIAQLYVRFKTKVSVWLKLIGPDGEEKSMIHVSPDETGAYLSMAGFGETPMPGKYKLIAETLFGAKVFEKVIGPFKGYNVKILDVKIIKEWNDVLGGSIEKITVVLENTGDLPTFIDYLNIYIDGKEYSVPFFSKPVPIGRTTIDALTLLTGITAGEHDVKIVLINDKGDTVASKSMKLSFP